ncbi:MAG: peptide deformylase [Myxococcales bacterium]
MGLAAPQVSLPLDDPEDLNRAQERKGVPFYVLINPKIEAVDPTPVTHFEGCLSIPGFSALVPRAKKVDVECRAAHRRVLVPPRRHRAQRGGAGKLTPRLTRTAAGPKWAGP